MKRRQKNEDFKPNKKAKKDRSTAKFTSQQKVPFSFFGLPLDVVSTIFDFFSLVDFANVALVQLSWTDCWSHVLILRIASENPKLYVNIGKCTNLTSLKWPTLDMSTEASQVPCLSKLTKLNELVIDGKYWPGFLESDIAHLTNLKYIDLRFVAFKSKTGWNCLTKLKLLQTLCIEQCWNSSFRREKNPPELEFGDSSCLSKLTSLKKLELRETLAYNSNVEFLTALTNLTELVIFACENLKPSWSNCLLKLTSLQNLKLNKIQFDTKVMSAQSNLINLTMYDSRGVNFDWIPRLTELQSLELSLVDEPFLWYLTQLTQLQGLSLRISKPGSILMRAVSHLTNLTHFRSAQQFEEPDFIMFQSLQKLQCIVLSNEAITEDMLLYLTTLKQLHTIIVEEEVTTTKIEQVGSFHCQVIPHAKKMLSKKQMVA